MDRGRSQDTSERDDAPVADASASVSLMLGIRRVFEGVRGLTGCVDTRFMNKCSVDLVVEEGREPGEAEVESRL